MNKPAEEPPRPDEADEPTEPATDSGVQGETANSSDKTSSESSSTEETSTGDEAAAKDDSGDSQSTEQDGSAADAEESGDEEPRDEDEEDEEDDELPDDEPLTPEIVEEEAIRNDFMLRWAVVLLAMLLACTEIYETQTLVHLRSGQHMARHGFLPPGEDIFSYTAGQGEVDEPRRWVNLSWLFDLTLYGVYALGNNFDRSDGGMIAVSIFKALLAAFAAAFLVHTSKRGVSTWWGSICTALAIIAAYAFFTATTSIITLLGLAAVCWILTDWKEQESSKRIWWLVPVFLVWANTDPRMFLGLFFLLLYAIGEGIGALGGMPDFNSSAKRRTLWAAIGACLLVVLVNPFTWNVFESPYRLFAVEYPGLRSHYTVLAVQHLDYFELKRSLEWELLDHRLLGGMIVALAALVTIFLNWRSASVGHVLVFVGFVSLAVLTRHELPAAAFVVCVLAALNAQEWYQGNFRQSYSVELGERAFSVGGRVVTVLAMVGVAYLAISGYLNGPNERRVGVGWNSELKVAVDAVGRDLDDSLDDRPFNFLLEQGDLFIWNNQKVFVDSRVDFYAGRGEEEDLLALHEKVRQAIRLPRSNDNRTGRPEVWKKAFDRFDVTHVAAWMGQPNPHYVAYLELSASPDWRLTHLGPATAVFYRTDSNDPELAAYRNENAINLVEITFREEQEKAEVRAGWPQSSSPYRWLRIPETPQSQGLWLARHYRQHLVFLAEQQGLTEATMALAYLLIRQANAALAEDPNNSVAFQLLGDAYNELGRLETVLTNSNLRMQRRRMQAIAAYNQAVIVDPDNLAAHQKLQEIYALTAKLDLALRELDAMQRIVSEVEVEDEEGKKQLTEAHDTITKTREAIRDRIKDAEEAIEEGMSQWEKAYQDSPTAKSDDKNQRDIQNLTQRASLHYQNGLILKTLKLLEEKPNLVELDPHLQLLKASVLFETGRVESAYDTMRQVEDTARQMRILDWYRSMSITALANAQYELSAEVSREQMHEFNEMWLSSALSTAPLVSQPHPLRWPIDHVRAVEGTLYSRTEDVAEPLFDVAVSHLEAGENDKAEAAFRELIGEAPETTLRPLVWFYLSLLSDDVIELEPPSQWIPIRGDMFVPEVDEPEPTEPDSGQAESSDSQPSESEGNDGESTNRD